MMNFDNDEREECRESIVFSSHKGENLPYLWGPPSCEGDREYPLLTRIDSILRYLGLM